MQIATVVNLGPIQAREWSSSDVKPDQVINNLIIGAVLGAMYRKTGTLSSSYFTVAESFCVFEYSQKRFLDKTRTWAEEGVETDGIVIVTNICDVDVVGKLIRPATEIEKLALEVRHGR